MNVHRFHNDCLNELLDKLPKEKETIILLGNFNINLINYDIDSPTTEFLDSLLSHYFAPHITL